MYLPNFLKFVLFQRSLLSVNCTILFVGLAQWEHDTFHHKASCHVSWGGSINEYCEGNFLAENYTLTFSFSKAHISELCLPLPHFPCSEAHQTVLILSRKPLGWACFLFCTAALLAQAASSDWNLDILSVLPVRSWLTSADAPSSALQPRFSSLPEFPEQDSAVSVVFIYIALAPCND